MSLCKPQATTIEDKDLHLFRLRKISECVSTNVLHQIFCEETKGRKSSETLFEFYKVKKFSIATFKKNLNKEQTEKIEKDPEGKYFDLTLLFICIQWGSINVANNNDKKWKEGNESLESCLTAIKNRRNELYHNVPTYNKEMFFKKTEDLRQLLTKTLKLAGILYGISPTIVDHKIKDIDIDINFLRDKSLIPKNYADYKEQNLFLEKSKKVRCEGKVFLDKLYDGWDSIRPASLILHHQFKVNLIFTQMVLLGESQKGEEDMEQKYEDLLMNISHTISDPVILVEGIAGVGKTTFTKKMLSDWVSGNSTMQILPCYNLLLYAECRNKSIKSFKDLIVNLMPDLSRCFQDDDFSQVVLDQKIILIMDGLDELNPSSRSLFDDVLELKRTNDRFTIMITTRPEKVETYYSLANHLNIQTKHIRLIGIPIEKINEFVIKYEEEMKKESLSKDDISKLLDHLKKTAYRLKDVWMLPYNLILLLILWRKDPSDVYAINTAPELYWKIHQMVRSKLISRLLRNTSEGFPEKKVDKFISSLTMEALVGLIKDDINLPEEAYNRLKIVCVKENIPHEEMTGAFLKTVIIKTSLRMDKEYSFPHKGFQEFAAAHNIFHDILCRLEIRDVSKAEEDFKQFLLTHKLPQYLGRDFLRKMKEYCHDATASTSASTASTQAGTWSHDSTVIKDILEGHHGRSPLKLDKFQNVFIILIGMFNLHTGKFQERIQMEALLLLEKSGIKHRTDWIRILNSVKCDAFVATFISQRPGILDHDRSGVLKIEDFSLFAYITLLKALQSPLEGTNDVMMIDIDIQEDLIDLNELLEIINANQYNVRRIYLHHNFKHLYANLMVEDAINNIFQRCEVVSYKGRVTPDLELPFSLRKLWSSVADDDSIEHLQRFLNSSKQQLEELHVCVSTNIDHQLLQDLPGRCNYPPSLYITDIKDAKDVSRASLIVQKFLPATGRKKFGNLCFPRCTSSVLVEELLKQLGSINELKVAALIFSSSCRATEEQHDYLQNLTWNIKGAPDLLWGTESTDGSTNIDNW